jgi:hypothetical protein
MSVWESVCCETLIDLIELNSIQGFKQEWSWIKFLGAIKIYTVNKYTVFSLSVVF